MVRCAHNTPATPPAAWQTNPPRGPGHCRARPVALEPSSAARLGMPPGQSSPRRSALAGGGGGRRDAGPVCRGDHRRPARAMSRGRSPVATAEPTEATGRAARSGSAPPRPRVIGRPRCPPASPACARSDAEAAAPASPSRRALRARGRHRGRRAAAARCATLRVQLRASALTRRLAAPPCRRHGSPAPDFGDRRPADIPEALVGSAGAARKGSAQITNIVQTQIRRHRGPPPPAGPLHEYLHRTMLHYLSEADGPAGRRHRGQRECAAANARHR